MISAEAEIAYGERWRASIPAEFAALPVKPPKAPKAPVVDQFDQFLQGMAARCGIGLSRALTISDMMSYPGMRPLFEEHRKWSPGAINHWFAYHKDKPYGAYALFRTIRPGWGKPILWHVDVLPPS
jgi:hypothetical protein